MGPAISSLPSKATKSRHLSSVLPRLNKSGRRWAVLACLRKSMAFQLVAPGGFLYCLHNSGMAAPEVEMKPRASIRAAPQAPFRTPIHRGKAQDTASHRLLGCVTVFLLMSDCMAPHFLGPNMLSITVTLPY